MIKETGANGAAAFMIMTIIIYHGAEHIRTAAVRTEISAMILWIAEAIT